MKSIYLQDLVFDESELATLNEVEKEKSDESDAPIQFVEVIDQFSRPPLSVPVQGIIKDKQSELGKRTFEESEMTEQQVFPQQN